MQVIRAIIKELDRCIDKSSQMFDREFSQLKRVREEHRGQEQISVSTGGIITGLCLGCNKQDVAYSIHGIWIEGNREGQAEITWTCRICGKIYNYHGPRAKVIGQLGNITPPMAA